MKNQFKSKLLKVEECSLEILFVEIKINRKIYILGSVYLPPNCSSNDFVIYTHVLENILSNYKRQQQVTLVLTGDYNCSNISWDPMTFKPTTMINYSCSADNLISCTEFHSLFQLNHALNSDNRILDLVLTNNDNLIKVHQSEDNILEVDELHPPLSISLRLDKNPRKKNLTSDKPIVIKDFKENENDFPELSKFYTDKFNNSITFNPHQELESLIDDFYKILYEGIEQFIPSKIIKQPKFPIWFSAELKDLI